MLKFYSRISGKTELFQAHDRSVKIFVCGPTLYDDLHLGHLRVLLATDLLRRYFEYNGLQYKIVINLTDMDLKISERAEKEKMKPEEIIERYYERVTLDISELLGKNITFVRPSTYIEQSIEIIENLKGKGLTYQTKNGIYCDISKSKHLGELSRMDRETILHTILEPDENKRNPCDFRLWMNAGYENNKIYGTGMVGWHLQDFTVLKTLFEGVCDIHVGAKELIFPHHEFIQIIGEYYSGTYPVSRFFLHTGLLKYKGDKMSKSLGNIIYYRSIKKEFDLDAIRLYYYGLDQKRDYSFNENLLIYNKKLVNKMLPKINRSKKGININKRILEYKNRFIKSLENNLNSRKAIKEWIELNKFVTRKSLDEGSVELLKEAYRTFTSLTGILEGLTIE